MGRSAEVTNAFHAIHTCNDINGLGMNITFSPVLVFHMQRVPFITIQRRFSLQDLQGSVTQPLNGDLFNMSFSHPYCIYRSRATHIVPDS